jgi:voltage-gated potassium channel Kch
MMHEVNSEKLRDHFIICGYRYMGRAVVDRLNRSEMPFVVIETNDELHREILTECL